MGFDPLLWCKFEKIENKSDLEVKLAKTAQIVESAIETIKANLKKLIQQKIIHGKIVSNPDEFGSYFIKMEEEKEFKQKALKDSLLEIEEFFEESYPIVFYIPPSFIKRIDEIIAEAKRYNFDLLGNKKSVHFNSWPDVEKVDNDLEKKMELVREIVQDILSQREKAKLGIRWPLGKVSISCEEKLNEFSGIIKNQTNVKSVEFKKGKLNVLLDTKVTPELESEGYAREVMRAIQALRKKNKLERKDRIKLSINSSYDISKFSKDIKERVGAKEIIFGAKKYKIYSKEKVKGQEFDISFQKV